MDRWLNKILLGDCLDIMREMPDKCVDLVLTDPPYGIDAGSGTAVYIVNKKWGQDHEKRRNITTGDWDKKRPDKAYFDEIKRVAKNYIIWGGNYFSDYLEGSPCWIVWDKCNGDSFFADGELAATSFNTKLRICRKLSQGFIKSKDDKEDRIHPTQKPVSLFEWILKLYSKPGDIILDPFLGSGTTVAACINLERQYIGIEISPDYVLASQQRIKKATEQRRLFL